MRKFLSTLLLLGLTGVGLAIEPKPVGSGETCDLPASQHIRNVGGSDGAGLCVFTSGQHAAIFQNITELDGFREWMRSQPGGGYPEKFDACVKRYCSLKGRPVPQYIQHTGGDEEFLTEALRTSRIVCVTYAGRDDFYKNQTIAHMVNLVYLSATEAAILDNNRPGEMVWMTRKEFLDRWKGLAADGSPLYIGRSTVGGGWAIAFIAPPPTPHVRDSRLAFGGKCTCGENCKCLDKDRCFCANQTVFGQCANGQCRIPQSAPVIVDTSLDGWVPAGEGVHLLYSRGVFRGQHDDKGFHPAAGSSKEAGIFVQTSELPAGVESPNAPPTGVEFHKLPAEHLWVLNGRKVHRAEAFAALTQGITDDTSKWHLAFVGDQSAVSNAQAKVNSLPADVRAKLLVQFYSPDSWVAKDNKWAKGVFLIAPTATRTGDLLGSVDDITDLLKLLALKGGPLYVEPKPEPTPTDPNPAVPAPVAKPNYLVWGGVAGILFLLLVLRKKG